MNDKINLELNEEEIKAIKDYTGYQHTAINMIGSLDYKKLQKSIKAGWKMPEKKEELEQLINKFINIYSVIYKKGENSSLGNIYRGVTDSELRDFEQNEKINKILSTSCSEEIAKTFLPYEKNGLLRINTTNKIKRLYIEQYRDKDRRNEKEILIEPFCTVKTSQFVSKWNGINYYNVSLDREELPDISNDEIMILENECINNFEEYLENSRKYSELQSENEFLYFQLRGQRIDIREWQEQDDKISVKLSCITKELEEYQDKFLKMIKGKCRQKEIQIDKEKEKIKKEEQERKIQEENKKISELKEKINKKREYIINSLEINFEELKNVLYSNQILSEKLGIETTQYSIDFYKEFIEEIKNKIQENKEKSEEKENKNNENINIKLQEQEIKLNQIEKVLSDMPRIIEMQEKEQIGEIKFKLNDKVNNIIYKIKLENLELEKQRIRRTKNLNFW